MLLILRIFLLLSCLIFCFSLLLGCRYLCVKSVCIIYLDLHRSGSQIVALLWFKSTGIVPCGLIIDCIFCIADSDVILCIKINIITDIFRSAGFHPDSILTQQSRRSYNCIRRVYRLCIQKHRSYMLTRICVSRQITDKHGKHIVVFHIGIHKLYIQNITVLRRIFIQLSLILADRNTGTGSSYHLPSLNLICLCCQYGYCSCTYGHCHHTCHCQCRHLFHSFFHHLFSPFLFLIIYIFSFSSRRFTFWEGPAS